MTSRRGQITFILFEIRAPSRSRTGTDYIAAQSADRLALRHPRSGETCMTCCPPLK